MIDFNVGEVLLVDGYNGDNAKRFGRIERADLNRFGKPYVTVYRDKEGETEGAYRSYHPEKFTNARSSGLKVV